jgi:hypothetical protein
MRTPAHHHRGSGVRPPHRSQQHQAVARIRRRGELVIISAVTLSVRRIDALIGATSDRAVRRHRTEGHPCGLANRDELAVVPGDLAGRLDDVAGPLTADLFVTAGFWWLFFGRWEVGELIETGVPVDYR